MTSSGERQGTRNLIVGAASNALLVAVKILLGLLGRSQALIADAVHTFTDFGTDILAFFGLKYAFKGKDSDHPYGHGKIDTLMSLLIGVAMLLAAMWLAFEAIINIIQGNLVQPNLWAMAGALLSIAIKEALFQYTFRVGVRIGNQSLVANAWHHRSDAISSVAVVLGLIPAILNPGLAVFDSLAAILVAGMIFKLGLDIIVPAFRNVSDAAPDDQQIEHIRRIIYSVDGVRNAHDIRARSYSSKLHVETHIIVDPDITVRQGHDIAAAVRHRLKEELPNVLDTIVHIDPDDSDHAHHHNEQPPPA